MYIIGNDIEKRNTMLENLNYFYTEKKGMTVQEDLEIVCLTNLVDENSSIALEQTLMDYAYTQTNEDVIFFGERRHISPKSYLSNDYEKASITFNTRISDYITVEITEDLCQNYRENYLNILNETQERSR